MAQATTDVDLQHTAVRAPASGVLCICYLVAVAVLTWLARDLTTCVYLLSFWHYYLYWLAYRFGAVPLGVFVRDAMLMKGVALSLLAVVYFRSPLHVVSLAVSAAGFSLNALAARALGADRTYYGYEVASLPRQRITLFPYSWVSHPMLLGNIAGFGGLLLNYDFARAWWPLACVHVTLNFGLLAMEVAVEPLRLGAQRQAVWSPRAGEAARVHLLPDWLPAAVVAGALAWLVTGRAVSWAGTTGVVCSAAFAALLHRWYSVPNNWGNRPTAFYERTLDEC